MPSLAENFSMFGETYDWSRRGDEWSDAWGGVSYQWWTTVFPRLQGYVPAPRILEIAPGYGRWTQFLRGLCEELIIVDIAERAIAHCRERFAEDGHIRAYVNDGTSLAMVPDGSIDLVFCFDSLVHAESDVMEGYVTELARVLTVNGVAFVHHSNVGAYPAAAYDPTEILWRATSVSRELIEQLAVSAGLSCISQETIRWGHPNLLIDCISVMTRAGSQWDRGNVLVENWDFNREVAVARQLSSQYPPNFRISLEDCGPNRAQRADVSRSSVASTVDQQHGQLATPARPAPGLPAKHLRVNLICPLHDPREIGRVDAFERLAGHLGRLCSLRLLTMQPPLHPMPHVDVRTTVKPDADEMSDCDVVLYPADLVGGAELASSVASVALMDGFAAPDEEMLASLAAAKLVLAASGSLCELARRTGAPVIHLPLGLDPVLFAAGPPNQERKLSVTAITQSEHQDWELLSEAMVRIREARPEVEVTLIGGVPADGATRFLSHPPVGAMADALRSSAVHVTGFGEQGLSYITAAALACGAALVSTRDAASSDFVVTGRTALVVRREPKTVAKHVLALLDDPNRRAELANDGAQLVRVLMPPWQELARRLAMVLARVAERSQGDARSVTQGSPPTVARSPDGVSAAPNGRAADRARTDVTPDPTGA